MTINDTGKRKDQELPQDVETGFCSASVPTSAPPSVSCDPPVSFGGKSRDDHESISMPSGVYPEIMSNDWAHVYPAGQDATETLQQTPLDDECAPFPTLPPSVDHPIADQKIQYEFAQLQQCRNDITASTLIYAAWALVVGRMTKSENVPFGIPVIGRNLPGAGDGLVSDRSLETVSVCLKWTASQSVSSYLKTVQLRTADVLVEKSDLQQAARMLRESGKACKYQTLVLIPPLESSSDSQCTQEMPGNWHNGGQQHSSCALVLEMQPTSKMLAVGACFDARVLEPWLVYGLLKRLDHVLRQLETAGSGCSLAEIEIVTLQDLETIWEWNNTVPMAVERCIHEMVRDRAQSQPAAPAVHAWDGDLTYGELDRLSEQLAGHLIGLGVKPDMLIPLCFEKSMWMPVAMVGVLKAGGGFVLLDPSFPEQRLQVIVQEVMAGFILSSPSNMVLCLRLLKTVIRIDSDSVNAFEANNQRLQSQSSSTAMFGVFTSGSTGKPKGAILSHSNYSSALTYQLPLLGITKDSRLFDFASYAFDVSVHNVFAALTGGGCLCIPSEQDRQNNICKVMTDMRTTVAHLTPSVARLIHPTTVPLLQTIIFTGEPLSVDDVRRWWGKAHVVNEYGPAECSINTINCNPASPEKATSIGKGVGVVTWVVDADDPNSLVPLGCVGELLIEGPLVGRGYINNAEKNAIAFIETPQWLREGATGRPGRQGRLYMTGDLVKYNEDGSLAFLGRKDTQVKIRGQRVDLGEVEHWIQNCMPNAKQVVAEVVLPLGEDPSPTLVAFLQVDDEGTGAIVPDAALTRVLPVPTDVEAKLAKHLPVYMVPTVCFSMPQFPMGATGKMDRKRLREIGSSFSVKQLAEARTAGSGPKRQPSSEMEHHVQKIWAQVLGINPSPIGLDDSFFHLGGDSIAAMKVVGEARKIGIKLAVADIFRHPSLYDLAMHSHYIGNNSPEHISPFALLGDEFSLASFLGDISRHYQIESTTIRDAYPCTPLQEGFIFLTSKRPGDYIEQNVLEIAPDVAVKDLCTAWEQVTRAMPILRTRLAQHNDLGLMQLVLDDEFRWLDATGLEKYLDADRKRSMNLGEPLSRYALVRDDTGLPKWFVWTIHHAIYDGWSMRLIMDAAYRAYRSEPIDQGPQFQAFIKYVKEKDDERMSEYWQITLGDYEGVPFPPLTPPLDQPVADTVVEHCIPNSQNKRGGITTSMLVRAAWALAVGGMANTDDVVFGSTVYGRNASVAGLDELAAPTIATVPVRVRLPRDQKISEYLATVQREAAEMIPFEQTGLQSIAKVCPGSQKACMFQTHLVIQPEENGYGQGPLGKWQNGTQEQWFSTYALTLELCLRTDNIAVSAMFDSRVIELWVVRKMLQRLEWVMHQLDHTTTTQVLADIKMSTPEDLELLWEWNTIVPAQVDRCIHEIINDRVLAQPEAPAICAWDGELSYSRLDQLATGLSGRLMELGVGEGMLIPLCFEKSMWTTVAILGLLKTGAGFILLDPYLPEERLRAIIKQVKADLIISSPSNQDLCSRLAATVVTLSWSFFSGLGNQTSRQIHIPCPSSVLYAIFTSGTTGTPKGVLVTHTNITSAFQHQVELMGLTAESRLFDFASYSFDVSISNIFTILAAGGCLCVPSEDDRKNNLEKSIVSLRANALDLTPSIARLLSPTRLPEIRLLTLGGERLRVADVEHWYGKVRICNAYGPSECTATSTINHGASSPEGATHIGKGAGLVTWVVDPNNHNELLPPGYTGELLLEGPLIGCGYLNDTDKTAASFVHDPVWLLRGSLGTPGRHGRLYKTGDLVKYNEDGNLMFVRRKDAQVKIRGQRVELGEIEHVLRSHDCVDDAVAVLQRDEREEAWIASFVTVRDGDAVLEERPGNCEEAQQQITSWEDQFDGDMYASIETIQAKTIGRDFMGWTSMYDGNEIDIGEMNEWLDDAIHTILNGGSAGHVLEIGTGSGMMLFNLANHGLQSYVGVEPSGRAVDFIAKTAKSIPTLADKVKIFKATAADVARLDTPISPSLVIINSVIQYFPSQEYLLQVIQDLVQLQSVEIIFFGDVRSYALHEEFLAMRALHITGENASKEDVQRVLHNLKKAEPELLLDPGFFTSLPSRLPGHIEHVEILPKRMEATNELSSYRYAAVVHVNSRHRRQQIQPIQDVRQESWIDFTSQGLDPQSLSDLLHGPSVAATVAISNIPYSKNVFARDVIHSLENHGKEVQDQNHWLLAVRQNAHHCHSLSAFDLTKIAQQGGYQVEISWARQHSQRGGLDAVFHRCTANGSGRRILFRFPVDRQDRPYHLLSSNPLRQQMEAKVHEELEKKLQSQLPSYMVPQSVTILERMPVNKNGKIDRRMLAESHKTQTVGQRVKRLPTTAKETEMQRIWSLVLNIKLDSIGVDDGFIQLGGNSLGAMKVVTMAREAGITLAVADMFRHPITSIQRLLQSTPDDGINEQNSPDALSSADLMAEIARHDARIASVQTGVRSSFQIADEDVQAESNKPLTVVLTGANGFIGTQILRQLLEHGRVGRVIAIVRGESADIARQRTIDAAKRALWWTEFHQEMLEVWPGDLSLPHLGLDPAYWRLIADGKTVDMVIHNGAAVHFMKSYAALEAANVDSTTEMLCVVAATIRMKFIYVSSARYQDPTEEHEEDVIRDLTANPNGYNQTKFVAEALVRRAALRSSHKQNQFAVVSPGLVIGTPTEGVANADDWIWRMAAACIRVGVYNNDNSNKWIPISDAAATATVIIDTALDHTSTVMTQVRGGMTLGEFWATLVTTGYHLKASGASECTAAIRKDIEANKETHPLWALADMLESLEETAKVQWANSWCNSGFSPVRLKVALRKSAEFLSKVGFLPLPVPSTGNQVQTPALSAFFRSGV